MFEKIKAKIDDFEEKANTFIDDHPVTLGVAAFGAYLVVAIGIMGYYAYNAKSYRMLTEALKDANQIIMGMDLD